MKISKENYISISDWSTGDGENKTGCPIVANSLFFVVPVCIFNKPLTKRCYLTNICNLKSIIPKRTVSKNAILIKKNLKRGESILEFSLTDSL